MWIALTACAACGPMYQAPGGQPPPAPPAAAPSAPGDLPAEEAGSPPADRSADEVSAETAAIGSPGDPYVTEARAAKPARPSRAASRAISDEAAAWLDAHNRVRAKHCAAPLGWSAKLAQVAQRWANALRDRGCMFGHSNGAFGENLAAGTSGTLDPASVVEMWYDEVAGYRFPNGGFSMKTGHFTQVVWRGTTQVGCGRSQCKGMDLWVCEYDPAGNWEGKYRQNVLPTGCR